MQFFQNMYISEAIASSAEELIIKIKQNNPTPKVYLITFASNPQNLLDLIPSKDLLQEAYPKQELVVIGLAKGKKDAMKLAEHIIGELYEQTGGFDIRNWLRQKEETT